MESNYGAAGPITAAQKIAEVACERVGEFKGLAMPPRFWQEAAWKKEYGRQVQQAHKLLKVCDPEAVFAALRNNPKVRSLGAGFFFDLVAAEQDKIDAARRRAETAAPTESRDASQAPRQGVQRAKGVKSKLKGL